MVGGNQHVTFKVIRTSENFHSNSLGTFTCKQSVVLTLSTAALMIILWLEARQLASFSHLSPQSLYLHFSNDFAHRFLEPSFSLPFKLSHRISSPRCTKGQVKGTLTKHSEETLAWTAESGHLHTLITVKAMTGSPTMISPTERQRRIKCDPHYTHSLRGSEQ